MPVLANGYSSRYSSPQQLLQLRKLLEKKLEPAQDSVRIYPIGGNIEVLGQGRPTQNPDFLIL